MSNVLIAVGVALAFVAFIEYVRRTPSKPFEYKVYVPPKPPPGYRPKYSLMNDSEAAFYWELLRQLPQGYYVFPKMRIADVLHIMDGDGYYKRRNKVLPRHVDFVVCNSSFQPIVAIELNGGTHNRHDVAVRDSEKKAVFAEAGLRLETVRTGSIFAMYIKNLLQELKIIDQKP